MKVHYEKTIFEKIDEAMLEAARTGHVIDHIEVTPDEWSTIRTAVSQKIQPSHFVVWDSCWGANTMTYSGVNIRQATVG